MKAKTYLSFFTFPLASDLFPYTYTPFTFSPAGIVYYTPSQLIAALHVLYYRGILCIIKSFCTVRGYFGRNLFMDNYDILVTVTICVLIIISGVV